MIPTTTHHGEKPTAHVSTPPTQPQTWLFFDRDNYLKMFTATSKLWHPAAREAMAALGTERVVWIGIFGCGFTGGGR